MSTSRPNSEARTPRRHSVARWALPLILLVLVVGGIAWLVQNIPNWRTKTVTPTPANDDKPLLVFASKIAIWESPPEKAGKDDKEQAYVYKEFENGAKGHYDFFFRNVSSGEVEVGLISTSCDCASVQACVLPMDEWERASKLQQEKPGDSITYTQEPTWHELSADASKKPMLIKPNEVGVVRAQWIARKPAGQNLNLQPAIWSQPVGDSTARVGHRFMIPGTMTFPMRSFPPLVNVGVVPPGTTSRAEFDIWSATRDELNVKLTGAVPDPLFVVETRPLSKQECTELEKTLRANKIPTRVQAAHHVTVTVHESKDGRQLEQGAFYRKLPVLLDGFPHPDLQGPEIVGRVHGDIQIGGADDMGKIRFKSFDAGSSATKVVDLSTDAKIQLEYFNVNPAKLVVELNLDKKNSSAQRNRWKLRVTVPVDAFSGSFTDAHAVILRIVGEPARFVRIPIEGNVGQ